MNCSSVDVKAYALGEASGGAVEAAHIESCPNCRQELDRLSLTQRALLSLEEEEIPQRIAFVSDKIFEPRWWQRIWHSGPAMGFASALVLAAAIFVHAYARPVVTTAQTASVDTAQIEKRVQAELSKRLDTAVSTAVAQATADSRAREAKVAQMLDAAEKRFTLERQSDEAMMRETARYWQNKIGQLMVASNRTLEGGQ